MSLCWELPPSLILSFISYLFYLLSFLIKKISFFLSLCWELPPSLCLFGGSELHHSHALDLLPHFPSVYIFILFAKTFSFIDFLIFLGFLGSWNYLWTWGISKFSPTFFSFGFPLLFLGSSKSFYLTFDCGTPTNNIGVANIKLNVQFHWLDIYVAGFIVPLLRAILVWPG